MATRPRPWMFAVVVLVAGACGTRARTPSDGLLVGSDEEADGSFTEGDASAAGALDAYIEQNHVTVTIVTLRCAGDCADVQAIATGGQPPYSFRWDDGSTSPSRRVCPTSNTAYLVKVSDTAVAGELARPAESVEVPLTANVLACPDGGIPDAGAGGCDSVASVSPSGANPYGAWSYGWSSSLGASFTRHTAFYVSPSAVYAGLDVWTSGVVGIELNPGAYANPAATVVQSTTFSAPPGQFFLHPGPVGQYSIARWTAPRAGTYSVQAAFEGLDTGPTTTDVHVQHNGTDVAAGYINLDGGGNTFRASPAVNVAAGDTIDFAVGNGGNGYTDDSTGVEATVCPPASSSP